MRNGSVILSLPCKLRKNEKEPIGYNFGNLINLGNISNIKRSFKNFFMNKIKNKFDMLRESMENDISGKIYGTEWSLGVVISYRNRQPDTERTRLNGLGLRLIGSGHKRVKPL